MLLDFIITYFEFQECIKTFNINILDIHVPHEFSATFPVAGKDSLVGLAAEAAKKALQMAEVDADDVDLVLMCTSTPEDLFGSAPQVYIC